MEIKKLIGLIIFTLNMSGLGLVLYLGGLSLAERLFEKRKQKNAAETPSDQAKDNGDEVLISDDMIPDDNLLEDMDLSDLDDLDLDDLDDLE